MRLLTPKCALHIQTLTCAPKVFYTVRMKSGPFIKIVAEAFQVEEKTLVVYARALKEAGLLSMGARGINAPDMTCKDASIITIAVLATDKPSRCVEMVRRFKDLPIDLTKSNGPHPACFGIDERATLESVLTNIFSADLAADAPFETSPYLEVQQNARTASIDYSGGGIHFRDTSRSEEVRNADRRDIMGMRRNHGFASSELMPLYIPFWAERAQGKSWETILAETEADKVLWQNRKPGAEK